MSNIVQGLVWKTDFPSPIAKLIAVKLADWADDEGGTIYPSAGKVAKRTGCARSIVCKWQYAMEHCGLLQVVDRSKGGNHGETTERAFDLAVLRRITPQTDNDPAEAKLVERKIERDSVGKDGKPKKVKVVVFEIEDIPVRQTDTSSAADPSAKRTPPVRQTDTTRPPRGHNTSLIPKGIPKRSRAKISNSNLKSGEATEVVITRDSAHWTRWMAYLDETDRKLADRMRGHFMAYVTSRDPAPGAKLVLPQDGKPRLLKRERVAA